ncbi:MAG: AraC family transcriptional regulator [Blastocatellia bacterium]
MSQNRQTVQIDAGELLVRTLSLKLSNSHVIEDHEHTWGQIIFASRGVMQVDADGSRWIVPPMRCLWMPPAKDHSIRIIAETWMRTIYLSPGLTGNLPGDCKVLNVSPLLRELILEIVRLSMLSERNETHVHLTNVLIDQLAASDEVRFKLTMPVDQRAVRLANLISSEPSNKTPLGEMARMSGASQRTLERLFLLETGLSVGRWRTQARLMMAVTLLVEGNSVNQAAIASGYESTSSFVATFKREIGTTPGRYLQTL